MYEINYGSFWNFMHTLRAIYTRARGIQALAGCNFLRTWNFSWHRVENSPHIRHTWYVNIRKYSDSHCCAASRLKRPVCPRSRQKTYHPFPHVGKTNPMKLKATTSWAGSHAFSPSARTPEGSISNGSPNGRRFIASLVAREVRSLSSSSECITIFLRCWQCGAAGPHPFQTGTPKLTGKRRIQTHVLSGKPNRFK